MDWNILFALEATYSKIFAVIVYVYINTLRPYDSSWKAHSLPHIMNKVGEIPTENMILNVVFPKPSAKCPQTLQLISNVYANCTHHEYVTYSVLNYVFNIE